MVVKIPRPNEAVKV